MHRLPNKQHIRGALLLEWLIAIALGLFLSGLLVQLFQQTLSDHLDAEGRFETVMAAAITDRLLHDTLHQRGRLPCGDTPQQLNLVRNGAGTYWLNLFQHPLQIHPHGSPGADRIRRLGTAPGMRAAGSDVLVALNIEFPTVVTRHDETRASFTLKDNLNLKTGGFAVVCDEHLTVLFQVTDTPTQHQATWHGTVVSPGNCALRFDAQHPCMPQTSHHFSEGALLARLEPITWFIGNSYSGRGRSLYREHLTLSHTKARVSAEMHREEILQGIEMLRARQLPSDSATRPNLEIGFIAAADTRRPRPTYPIHLLGTDITGWLSDSQKLYYAHELSLAR